MYEFLVKIGETKERYPIQYHDNGEATVDNESEKEKWVLTTPFIRYKSYDSLKDDLVWDLSGAYCAIIIVHLMERCDLPPEVGDVDAGVISFNAVLRNWEETDACKEIKTTLSSLTLDYKITRIIGMACGPFTKTSQYNGSSRSAIQNAFLVSLKKLLEESHLGSDDVNCYAQDPAYSQTDQAILNRSGIEVMDDPDGFLQIDDTSLVFSCGPNICVKEVVTEIARPTILMWCAVRDESPKHRMTDPDSPRVREMINNEYDRFPFPEDNGDNFTTMAIYVKKTARVSLAD
ncbi:hypothetical protein BDV12DRAFT_176723 [Aspergillus spectabilis]